jgi:hypothetical protein
MIGHTALAGFPAWAGREDGVEAGCAAGDWSLHAIAQALLLCPEHAPWAQTDAPRPAKATAASDKTMIEVFIFPLLFFQHAQDQS